MSRRAGVPAILILFLAFLASCGSDSKPASSGSSGSASAQLKTITIFQTSHTLSFLPLYVAQRDGLFAKHGLNVEILDAPGDGAVNTAALDRGDAFALVASPEQAMLANAKGLDIRAVAAVTQTATQSLVGPPGYTPSGNPANDLRGKRIAITLAGHMTSIVALEALRAIGLDPATDVTLVEGEDPARIAAMKNGEADFAFVSQPSMARAQKEGVLGEPVMDTKTALGLYHGLSLLVTGKSADGDATTMQAMVDAIIEADKVVASQPDHAFDVARQEFPDTDPAVLRSAFEFVVKSGFWSPDGKLTDEGIARSVAVAADLGDLNAGDIDAAKAVDHRFGA